MAAADIRHEITHAIALTEEAEREARSVLAHGDDAQKVAAAGELEFLAGQERMLRRRLVELDLRITEHRTLFSWFRQQWFALGLIFESWIAHG